MKHIYTTIILLLYSLQACSISTMTDAEPFSILSKEGWWVISGMFISLVCLSLFLYVYEKKVFPKDRKVYKDSKFYQKNWEKLYYEKLVLFKSLSVGIIIYDKNGRQQEMNPVAAKILGIKDIQSHIAKQSLFFDDMPIANEYKERFRKGKDFDVQIQGYLNMSSTTVHDSDENSFDKSIIDIQIRRLKDAEDNTDGYFVILNDMTSKYEAEQRLIQSEARLKMALSAGKLNVWKYDVKNDQYSTLYGKTFFTDRCSLNQVASIVHPDDKSVFLEKSQTILAGKIDETDLILRLFNNKTNQYHTIANRISARKDEKKQVSYVIGVHKDITKSILYEQERERNHKKLEFVIRHANLVLWEYDVKTKLFKSYNEPLNGFNEEKLLSLNDYHRYMHPDDIARSGLMNFLNLMDEGRNESYSVDVRLRFCDTEAWKHCTISGSPFEKDTDGKVVKFVGFRKDNTEWNTLIEELKTINSQLNMALKAGNIVPFVWDMESNMVRITTRDRLENISDAFEKRHEGLALEKVLLNMPPDDRERVHTIFAKFKAGNISEVHDEIRYDAKQRYKEVFECNMIGIKSETGKVDKVMGCLLNITERKKMILNLEDARKSDRLKSAFLANMSHEIRTPLNAIVGFSQLLMEETDPDTKAEFVKIITFNNELLLKLINDILDLSKIEAGFTEMKITSFDFAEYFEEIAISMKIQCSNPNVKFISVNPYKSCIVELDKQRLAQILTNFVNNAIKYTPHGSITMGYKACENNIRIYVSDTGIGISDKKKGRVFERFEKLDDFAQGNGLGLSICKAIAEANGGSVGFTSNEGQGSTFWADLKCNPTVVE